MKNFDELMPCESNLETIQSKPLSIKALVKSYLRLLVLLFVSAVATCNAQHARTHHEYSDHVFQGMKFGLFEPQTSQGTQRYPLILYLHGSTDTVSRDLSWYADKVQRQTPCLVLTPKCEEPNLGWGDTWRAGHTLCMSKTLALVDSIIRKYPIDTKRLYIYGISMGAFGVFSVLAKEQGKFAAGYAICGGSAPDAANRLLDTPLWIFHGEQDDIVPVRLSRDVYQEIVRLGGKKVRYTEYAGVKHNSWENAGREKSLPAWLLQQRKTK